MWTEEKPTTSGYYFFYGDPHWDENRIHDETKGINPFKPEKYIIEVKYVRENFTIYIVDGTFIYHPKGVWWDTPIEFPKVD